MPIPVSFTVSKTSDCPSPNGLVDKVTAFVPRVVIFAALDTRLPRHCRARTESYIMRSGVPGTAPKVSVMPFSAALA